MQQADVKLAAGFAPVSEAHWRERAEAALKGRPFETLVSETLDGIKIGPIHGRAAVAAAIDASSRLPIIVQRIDLADPTAANRQALEDLENGAGGLALVLEAAATAGQGGLAVREAEDWRRVLQGVDLDLISVRLDPGAGGRDAAGLLLDLYEARGLDLSRVDLTLGLDPLSAMARDGAFVDETLVVERMTGIARRLDEAGFAGKAFLADTRAFHGAGATEAQELSVALANAVQQLRWLERCGQNLASAVRLVGFLLTADADQFLTIAKLRALRLLWRRAQEATDVEPTPAIVHVETAWRMLTRRDSHVNLLRTTTAAFAAMVGGADTIAVVPFTAASGEADSFARRLARNIPTILIEESGIGRVADPAAGSGHVEALTLALAEKAWEEFQEIERQGGLHAALASGFVQHRIAEAARKRRALIAARKLPLTSISEYPDLSTGGCATPRSGRRGRRPSIGAASPLPRERLSEPFERLRDAADARAERTGKCPTVFLARLGSLADFGPRAAWTENLLAAGGIGVKGDAALGAPELIDAFRASEAAIACLCSSDTVYATQAADAIRSLKAGGAKQVLVAGKPGAAEAERNAAGADGYLFAGQDVVEALARIHAALGIEPLGEAA